LKKVLFVATVDTHIISFHLPYLKWFKEHGYKVHVASNGDKKIEVCDKKHEICFERSPFKINNIKAYKQLKKIIQEEQFDIVHCHTPMGGVLARLASIKARKSKTKVIYTAHGFHFYKGAPILNWLLYYSIEKWLSKHTDCLITINSEDYELAKRKFKAKKIEFITGIGIDENKFNIETTEEEKLKLREELGLKKDDFIAIYIAEISKRKNQEFLIKALKNVIEENKEIHLILTGNDSLNGKCQKVSVELGINNNVHFLGYRTDIRKLIEISNLYVSTSRQEGLPVNIMEAMIMGKPIIATNCRGNRDLIKNEVNGCLIEQGDETEFANGFLNIFKNLEKWKEIGYNGKEDIKTYMLNEILKQMERIYTYIGEK